jgi:hypothetical protein
MSKQRFEADLRDTRVDLGLIWGDGKTLRYVVRFK